MSSLHHCVGSYLLHAIRSLTNRYFRLEKSTSGEGEWKNYCLDCVELAQRAKEAERERPTSAKIRMILKLLGDIENSSDGQEKTIIFSQFTSMLNLIEPFLEEKGIKYARCKRFSPPFLYSMLTVCFHCQMMAL